MNPIFKKLNYKDQEEIVVLNAPDSFRKDMEEMEELTKVLTTLPKGRKLRFIMAFVTKQKEVDELAAKLSGALEGDGVLWFTYPKGTSKKYKCDFNRDTGWDKVKQQGFDTVRMVAIDEDWSALRLRRVEYIKK